MTEYGQWIVVAALLTAGCSRQADTLEASAPAAALQVATTYAASHYPKGEFQPDGAPLEYHVVDARNAWKIDLQPVGHMGGGLVVLVRKPDMAVISALRTQ
jgi:hypothetical protein